MVTTLQLLPLAPSPRLSEELATPRVPGIRFDLPTELHVGIDTCGLSSGRASRLG